MFPNVDESWQGIEHILVVPRIKLPIRPQQMAPNMPATPRTDISFLRMPQGIPITPCPTVSLTKKRGNFQRLYALLPKRIFGFSLVGGSVMLGGITLLFVLVHFLHLEKHLAYLIQAITSIETNFFLNRFLNWKERDGNLAVQWLKFHTTSAITFPLNQALFALLTWIGINYLVVTLIGVGVAAIVNYFANDRFVFNRKDDTKRETIRVQSVKPLVPIRHVGVVIPIRNSQRTIRACLTSILEQNYSGQISVFLVGNVPEQDSTWSILGDMLRDSRVHCIQIRRPSEWVGRDANLKRYCGCEAAVSEGVDAIAFIDSQVVPPRDWLKRSVHLLQHYYIDGVAGRSYRNQEDNSFPGLYQDCSLFSEWPSFGEAYFLTKASFKKAPGLPVTNNLLITRRAWEQIYRKWPLKATYSWEDFRIAWELVSLGYIICCTDAVYVYRNHQRKFRLIKQFSAGAGALTLYREDPTCSYARKMLLKAGLVSATAILFGILIIAAVALGKDIFLAVLSGCFGFAWLVLGVVSAVKARDIRGLLFPILDTLHIGIWIAGAAYATWRAEATDVKLADLLVAWR